MELPTISKGAMGKQTGGERGQGTQQRPTQGLWRRRTGLEKVLIGVCGVALLGCAALIGVVASSGSSSSTSLPDTHVIVPAEEMIPQPQPLIAVQETKEVPAPQKAAKVETKPIKNSRLPVLKSKEDVEVCNTVECTLAAAELAKALDTSVDPCDNFYQFACGGWIKDNPVPDDASRWAQFDVLDRELTNAISTILSEPITGEENHYVAQSKSFYQGCMDEENLENQGLTPLTDFLGHFRGWPMTISDWTPDRFDFPVAIADSKTLAGGDHIASVWVFADQKDTFSTAIYIDQPTFGLPRSVLLKPENYEERIAAYKTYMSTTAKLVAESLGETIDPVQLEKEVENVLSFEKALAAITSPDEDRRDIDRMYNPMTMQELNDLSKMDWVFILSVMFDEANVKVNNETRIIVQEPAYISNLTQILTDYGLRNISNYMMWRHVKAMGDTTTRAMRDASFQYSMVANGVSAEPPRSIQCANEANNYMGIAIGTEYVKTYFPQQAKDEANEMVEDLREAFKILLDANEWMDDETKPKATEKADYISKFIGYPDWYGNETALNNYYHKLMDLDNLHHFQNTQRLRGWSAKEELDDFAKPSERERWFMPPTIVNAYYMPEYNSITFPAGILQPPFYRSNTIMALNFGGIGQVIGHEITHGFDDQGRQNDKVGNALPWWSNETLQAFKGHAQCIVDQYGNMRLPELDEHLPNATLNGINTQGENIADNGGIREALLAYQFYVNRYGEEPRLPGLTEYTPNQLFFLNNANIWCSSITTEGLLNQVLTDPHSPSRFRVMVPMLNTKEFADIWNCPAGSNMNPEERCVVW